MLIGVDASRALRARRTGTENYSLQLIRHLLLIGIEHRFRLYSDQVPPGEVFGGHADARDGAASEVKVMPFPRLWTHVRLSWELALNPPEVLFVPAHVLPMLHPRPSVCTIHDLGYWRHPEAHPRGQRVYLDWSTRWSARQSAHLLVDSEATKADVGTRYGIPSEKMSVVYPGRDETLGPVRDESVLSSLRSRLGLGRRYILYVGTLQPRKNLVRLVEAFSHMRDDGLQLVLAGQRGWLADPIYRRVEELGLTDAVVFPGYVQDEDLPSLLSGAIGFAFPSLHEGFGFPVLEAQACGTPVVVSDTSSLPEVAGDAAQYVDPYDVASIAAGLDSVVRHEVLRMELRELGLANVQRFSWRRCASETLAILEQVAGAP